MLTIMIIAVMVNLLPSDVHVQLHRTRRKVECHILQRGGKEREKHIQIYIKIRLNQYTRTSSKQ